MYRVEKVCSSRWWRYQQTVYLILKNLSARHILQFIPRRKVPYITYQHDRVDKQEIIISKEIYEDRKEQYIKRIDAVINYAENDNVCRSRQLLEYFGEENKHDCGRCDVCIAHKNETPSRHETETIKEKILEMLSDKQYHEITEFKSLNFPENLFKEVLNHLIEENKVILNYSEIKMP